MINNKTYRILACLLALLMFCTSIGVAMDMHYCGDRLQSFSLFGKAKTCTEQTKGIDQSCSRTGTHQHNGDGNHTGDHLEKKDCCHDKTLHIQSDQNQEVPSIEVKLQQPVQHFIVAFILAFLIQPDVQKNNPAAESYRPPLIRRDIFVLIQSFLL